MWKCLPVLICSHLSIHEFEYFSLFICLLAIFIPSSSSFCTKLVYTISTLLYIFICTGQFGTLSPYLNIQYGYIYCCGCLCSSCGSLIRPLMRCHCWFYNPSKLYYYSPFVFPCVHRIYFSFSLFFLVSPTYFYVDFKLTDIGTILIIHYQYKGRLHNSVICN